MTFRQKLEVLLGAIDAARIALDALRNGQPDRCAIEDVRGIWEISHRLLDLAVPDKLVDNDHSEGRFIWCGLLGYNSFNPRHGGTTIRAEMVARLNPFREVAEYTTPDEAVRMIHFLGIYEGAIRNHLQKTQRPQRLSAP